MFGYRPILRQAGVLSFEDRAREFDGLSSGLLTLTHVAAWMCCAGSEALQAVHNAPRTVAISLAAMFSDSTARGAHQQQRFGGVQLSTGPCLIPICGAPADNSESVSVAAIRKQRRIPHAQSAAAFQAQKRSGSEARAGRPGTAPNNGDVVTISNEGGWDRRRGERNAACWTPLAGRSKIRPSEHPHGVHIGIATHTALQLGIGRVAILTSFNSSDPCRRWQSLVNG